MRERPILFSGPMVRALLAGRKTQTRRLVKPQPKLVTCPGSKPFLWWNEEVLDACTGSPYGQPGDRLWVKETFFDVRPWRHEPLFGGVTGDFIYRAEYEYREERGQGKVIGSRNWRPSIFMPRAASRLVLELTEVRVERLNEISEADALAEGVDEFADGAGYTIRLGTGRPSAWQRNPEDAYRVLWEQLNGSGSWAANPWVWVLTFKRVEGRS